MVKTCIDDSVLMLIMVDYRLNCQLTGILCMMIDSNLWPLLLLC